MGQNINWWLAREGIDESTTIAEIVVEGSIRDGRLDDYVADRERFALPGQHGDTGREQLIASSFAFFVAPRWLSFDLIDCHGSSQSNYDEYVNIDTIVILD